MPVGILNVTLFMRNFAQRKLVSISIYWRSPI